MAQRYFPQGRVVAKVDGKSTGLAAACAGMGVVELPVMVGAAILDLTQLPGLQEPSDKDDCITATSGAPPGLSSWTCGGSSAL